MDTDRLIAEFGLAVSTIDVRPRFNLAPTQPVAAVVRGDEGLRLGLLRWGLVPGWASGPAVGTRMINARSETVSRKPAFREAFHERRCWILADGFYEWRREPDGRRTPMYIRLPSGAPFAFAGLWERWSRPGDEPVYSCTILTTTPADDIRGIHDRMPVILPAESRQLWLDPGARAEQLLALLRPFPRPLDAFPVSTRVNSPANDDPSLIERIAPLAPQSTRGGPAGDRIGG